MAGAIALAGMATLRSGAGLVTLAVPDPCLETVAGFDPCYMTVPLPCDDAGRLATEAGARVGQLAGRATAIACGPGLGRCAVLTQLVRDLYAKVTTTLVLDAASISSTSSDEPAVISTQVGHSLQGVADGPSTQFIALAKTRAVVVLPVPLGPQNK